jgi:hypothetical protein
MVDTFTIALLNLECQGAQEIDGDEIYLTAENRVLWRAAPDKMHHLPDMTDQVIEFDFAGGRKRTKDSWQPMMPYNPGDFILPNCDGVVLIQIWDADTITRDDLLGETPIDISQATGGAISVVFQRDGGHYRLTYRVDG